MVYWVSAAVPLVGSVGIELGIYVGTRQVKLTKVAAVPIWATVVLGTTLMPEQVVMDNVTPLVVGDILSDGVEDSVHIVGSLGVSGLGPY